MRLGAEELGIALEQHISNIIEALKPIAGKIGLASSAGFQPAVAG